MSRVIYLDDTKHFLYPLARQTIFCVNKMKVFMQKLIQEHEKDVVYCHTDSLILKDTALLSEFPIGVHLNQWKKEIDGECIIDKCIVKWKNKDGKYQNKNNKGFKPLAVHA